MKNLVDAKELDLFWEQPKLSQMRFILVAEEDIYAKLDFSSGFSTYALAATHDDEWTFKRVGFFSNRVIVRRAGSEIDLATYIPRWTGTEGALRFSTGEHYDWRVSNIWSSKYQLSTDNSQVLITYLSGSRNKKFSNLFKQQAQVIIDPKAWQLKDLSILIVLSWYLVILHYEDSSAVAVTASVAVLN